MAWKGLTSPMILCNCIPTDLYPCQRQSPCENHASCVNNVLGGYTCQCPDGYTGDICDTEVNECDPNPCQNGGTCIVCLLLPR